MNRIALVLTIAGLAVAQPALAQGNSRANGKDRDDRDDRDYRVSRADGRRYERGTDRVPPGHLPPPGKCRVWIDGVPPGRQPGVTDCRTAERNRVNDSRVIYGDDYSARGNGKYNKGRNGADDRDVFGRDRDRDDRDDDRAGGVFGRDRDGNRDDDRCSDANRDGRCDFVRSDYPQTLPGMEGAILIGRNQRTAGVQRWLGNAQVMPRYAVNGGRVPTEVTWVDGAGRIVQVWKDTNRDGRADRVDVYRNGRLLGIVR